MLSAVIKLPTFTLRSASLIGCVVLEKFWPPYLPRSASFARWLLADDWSAMVLPMSHGDFLTRLSIWLALVAYAIGAGLLLQARGRSHPRSLARGAWTLGCVFFLVHVFCAFAFFHHWSHADAYRKTARQTAELTGWHWGGGIYINYVFAAAWLAAVLWWWLAPASFDRRPAWLNVLWHGFLIFMVFNGTIVFGHGPVRLLGIVICIALAILWWQRKRPDGLKT
jgi:hypothetical protein